MPSPAPRTVDPDFTDLPLARWTDAALTAAQQAGASYAELRVERLRETYAELRDSQLVTNLDATDSGLGVRVVVDGVLGFAATAELTEESAAQAAHDACQAARVAAPLTTTRVELAAEPCYPNAQWVSEYDIDPFTVPLPDQAAYLAEWSQQLLSCGMTHVSADVHAVKEQKYFANSDGTHTTQQRVRIHPQLQATLVDEHGMETLRTLAPPVGRGWEYLIANPTQGGWDWAAELTQMPELLQEKHAAPSMEAGSYDVVIDASNLFLTIHESVGHATEMDRCLGFEAAFAGTSFITPEQVGVLQYGSEAMTITADRLTPHGLSTIGYDDEGVAAQQWDLVREGRLVTLQTDRRMAGLLGQQRSNGSAYASSWSTIPLQRMPNISLQPDPHGPDIAGLIAGVDDGLYIVGDKSWSIDMQRYNFQFTGQLFYRIRHGRLVGQVNHAAYQSTTTDFWRSLEAVGGPQTYSMGGAFTCAKAQPMQMAPVSHGSPAGLFRQVRILNTQSEAGR